jgi:hypothetical protein
MRPKSLKTTRATRLRISLHVRGVRHFDSPVFRGARMVILFFIPILILAIVAVFPAWPYNRRWGYYPTGGLGAILAITIVLLFMNRI